MKLHTAGTKTRIENSEEVLLRGVNSAGLEWDAGNESFCGRSPSGTAGIQSNLSVPCRSR